MKRREENFIFVVIIYAIAFFFLCFSTIPVLFLVILGFMGLILFVYTIKIFDSNKRKLLNRHLNKVKELRQNIEIKKRNILQINIETSKLIQKLDKLTKSKYYNYKI